MTVPGETSLRHFEIEAEDPEFFLARGEHRGFRWVVSHNGRGFRQGYVRIPAGHPWFGVEPNDIDARVHGALNWAWESPAGNWWVGFDAEHAFDLIDPELPCPPEVRAAYEIIGRSTVARMGARVGVRNQAYMEAECRSLCEQAEAASRTARESGP
jgi:hypothetical protein